KAGIEAALNRCGRLALKLRPNSVTRGSSISLTSWRWQTFAPSLSTIETGLRDLFGGAISGVVSIVYCVSYAAFIFSGPLAPWLGYGIAATFISTTIGALVVALRSSLPFTIAGPDCSTSVVTATFVAAFVQWLVANGATDHILGSTLFLMALSSALVGILLCGLGLAGAGRAVRFVPYPVIGGFLGATGWLMVLGARQVITDMRLAAANIYALLSPASLSKLTAAAAISVSPSFGVRRFWKPPFPARTHIGRDRSGTSRFLRNRPLNHRRTSRRLAVQARGRGRTHASLELRRAYPLPVAGTSAPGRRHHRPDVRDCDERAVQCDRD